MEFKPWIMKVTLLLMVMIIIGKDTLKVENLSLPITALMLYRKVKLTQVLILFRFIIGVAMGVYSLGTLKHNLGMNLINHRTRLLVNGTDWKDTKLMRLHFTLLEESLIILSKHTLFKENSRLRAKQKIILAVKWLVKLLPTASHQVGVDIPVSSCTTLILKVTMNMMLARGK